MRIAELLKSQIKGLEQFVKLFEKSVSLKGILDNKHYINDQNKKTQNESLPGTGVFSRKTLNWTGAPWEQAEVFFFVVLSD